MCLQNLLEINGNPWRNRDASTAVIRMAQQRLTCTTISQQRLFLIKRDGISKTTV